MHDRLFAHKKKSANLKEGKELLITFSGHRQIFFMKILNDFPKWDIFTSIELASSIHVHHSHVLQLTIEENFNRKKNMWMTLIEILRSFWWWNWKTTFSHFSTWIAATNCWAGDFTIHQTCIFYATSNGSMAVWFVAKCGKIELYSIKPICAQRAILIEQIIFLN